MIKFTYDIALSVYAITSENQTKQSTDIRDFFELLSYIQTSETDMEYLGKSVLYWQFLDAILGHIETGGWEILPGFWLQAIIGTAHNELSNVQISAFNRLYTVKRSELIKRLGLNKKVNPDRELILKWIRNESGEKHIMAVAQTLMHAWLKYTNTHLDPSLTSPVHILGKYDNATGGIYRENSNTKQQRVKNAIYHKQFLTDLGKMT